jgi:hypothetical protein
MPAEDELVAPAATAAVPKWIRPFSFLARSIKGWNFLLALPLIALSIAAVSIPPTIVYELCEGDGFTRNERLVGCLSDNAILIGLGEAFAVIAILVTFLVLGAGFGWIGHRRRARRVRRGYEQRMQRVRDHVITGSVTPETFDEVQRLWKPLVRGEHPAMRARAGTSTTLIFNVLTSLTLGVAITIYAVGMIATTIDEGDVDERDEFQVIWNAMFVPLLLGFGIATIGGWVVFPRAHSLAVHGADDAVDALERAEVRTVAGVPFARRPKTAVIADGPSYAPYSGRSRTD